MPRRPRYESLDLWRGVACLLVVVIHSTFYVTHDRLDSPLLHSWESLTAAVLERLWIGMPMFFVISGYCIAASADAMQRKGTPTRTYFWRRFRRIYPMEPSRKLGPGNVRESIPA